MKKIIILSVIGLFLVGLITSTSMLGYYLSKEIDKSTSLNAKNITISKELATKIEELKISKKSEQDLYQVGYIVADWKVRTEKIMVKIDNLFAEYAANQNEYCLIYDSERKYWKQEDDRITKEYYKVIDELKQLMGEQEKYK